MPRYICGYVAKSLADIGNLDGRLEVGGENTTMKKFDKAWAEVEQMVKDVRIEEREWRGSIAIREGDQGKKEPVIVLGVVYEQGQQRPEIPAALTRLFPKEKTVNLRLSYQG